MVGGQCGKTFRNLSGLEAWLAAKLARKVFSVRKGSLLWQRLFRMLNGHLSLTVSG